MIARGAKVSHVDKVSYSLSVWDEVAVSLSDMLPKSVTLQYTSSYVLMLILAIEY